MVGRKINLEEEVEPIGEKRLMDTFFKEGRKPQKLMSLQTRLESGFFSLIP